VLESAVFGLPHPDLGEAVTAAVVLSAATAAAAVPTELEILARLRIRLAAYKLPKRVLLVEQLPRNVMGKVQKAALRAQYAALYQAPTPVTGA
jgi:malonyl-CoA/methylmalonyl-CoA synthetase